MPSEAIISGFKGVVDFYVHDGIPCFRQWPRSPGKKRSPAVEAQWISFSIAASRWKEVSPDIQTAYNTMASGSGLTGRDMFTRSYIKGLFAYPTGEEYVMGTIWKDESERALNDLNRNSTQAFTDLDLTPFTSATAKFALLQIYIHVDSISSGGLATFYLRKNGTTPTWPITLSTRYVNGDRAGARIYAHVTVGLDSEQIVEWGITVVGTIQLDTEIIVLGYVE